MAKERLIVFTRYPEPGKTKTRLIPALGTQGAADLQRQMTEYTLNQVRKLQTWRSISIEVRYAGGDRQLMQEWLGNDLVYQIQGEGDLGMRMARSHSTAFASSFDSAIIIGTDCPGLKAQLMAEAFDRLLAHDLVLGPAIDGGYYLIGLRRCIPELFALPSWGTAEVFQQTVEIAQNLNLSIAALTPLADVDRPEDLLVWEREVEKSWASFKDLRNFSIVRSHIANRISIIIPVLNEAENLSATLTNALLGTDVEVIVVDGGSQDGTIELSQSFGVKVLSALTGRADQMNAGAMVANGDILLFLHGDTLLPSGFDTLVRQALKPPGVVAGAFELQIGGSLNLPLIERGVNWRSHWLQLPYGDQAIFLPAELFHAIGGFPALPIMEDFELIHQLKRLGRIIIIPVPVLTSGRRWQRLGVLKTTLINCGAIVTYLLGVSPEQIALWYRRY